MNTRVYEGTASNEAGVAASDPKPHNALRPDAQAFDEVRIVTVPRYKESELSGDEWRISAEVQLIRKGEIVHRQSFGDVEHAVQGLGFVWMRACDDGLGYFAGDGVTCDQEGCPAQAQYRYRVLKHYCREGHDSIPYDPTYRHFCARHKVRGDCGLDDSDSNYAQEPWK